MDKIRARVDRLETQHTKAELQAQLAVELGDAYTEAIPGNLHNDFLDACYRRLAPDEDLFDRLRTHENFADAWHEKGRKHNLATALRMLLTERVGRNAHDSITSVTNQLLAELIVASRMTDAGRAGDADRTTPDAPPRAAPAPSPFSDALPVAEASAATIANWVDARQNERDGPYAVYVLDCTPPVAAASERLRSLRATAAEKANAETALSELEQAGAALTNGERLYYVGYTADVPTRIRQHCKGAAASATRFTNFFTPGALVEVAWFDTADAAKQRERERARELTVPGESFAHYN